jgi:hypothetical protein
MRQPRECSWARLAAVEPAGCVCVQSGDSWELCSKPQRDWRASDLEAAAGLCVAASVAAMLSTVWLRVCALIAAVMLVTKTVAVTATPWTDGPLRGLRGCRESHSFVQQQ